MCCICFAVVFHLNYISLNFEIFIIRLVGYDASKGEKVSQVQRIDSVAQTYVVLVRRAIMREMNASNGMASLRDCYDKCISCWFKVGMDVSDTGKIF
ncbi:MAG: hypothetical protein EZS28_008486 [Streblomastix strix]|uniref:Uncharacterized protein n=1 Tax=Streblomastix strix TaxID=222440 RepID=A0A5J4WLN8_9EUKA|nr:MAG: hypothetical protein EZS28_008486 [Streblomastix strix]